MMDVISILLGLGSKLIENLFPDPAVAAQAKLNLLKLQQDGVLAQISAQTDINKVEAANPNLFVSGWRPFIGWVCGFGLCMQFLISPLFTWVTALSGHSIVFPSLDMGTLLTLLGGMLGLGGLRTVEKIRRVGSK
jgi:hypothetical protein